MSNEVQDMPDVRSPDKYNPEEGDNPVSGVAMMERQSRTFSEA
jgi:hypothetical protein